MLNLESPYNLHYQNLLNEINQENCIAFIGAGLSKEAGYPLWKDLLETLIQRAELDESIPAEPNIKAYLEIAEQCKNRLSDRYYPLLEEIFNPVGKSHFLDHHTYLSRVPFIGYLTTNYDPCLQKASRVLDMEIQERIRPDLDPTLLSQKPRTIFHIHGIAFDSSGRNMVNTIVLTKTEYEEVYHTSASLKSLLYSAFCYKTILFLGFGMSDGDQFLLEILEIARRDYESRQRQRQETGQNLLPSKKHFIIRPNYFVEDTARQSVK